MDISVILELIGGIGLFLYGMKSMGTGLERAAGRKLKYILGVLTKNRFTGLLAGTLFTALIQSSAVTVVMVVGFVNANLMTLLQATGLIMGANIGTTITGHLIALDLGGIAPVFVTVGVVLIMFFKGEKLKQIGEVLAGFGVLFIGMGMMSEAMEVIRENETVRKIIMAAANPFVAVLVGIIFTAIIQSSSASVGIFQLMAMENLISLDMAIFLTLGSGIGTCITALLASVGTTSNAKRAAIIHLSLNVFGTILIGIAVSLFPFTEFVRSHLGSTDLQRVANVNSLFKVVEVVIFFPIAGLLVKAANLVVPDREEDAGDKKLMFLDDRLLNTPPIAAEQVTKEIERMGRIAVNNLERATNMFFSEDTALDRAVYNEVEKDEEVVSYLNHEITRFMIELAKRKLENRTMEKVATCFHVCNDIERIGDHAENMAEFALKRDEDKITFSENGVSELREMLTHVIEICHMALDAFANEDHSRLTAILVREEMVDDMEKEYQQAHVDRLTQGICTPMSGMLFSDMLSNLERVSDHATNIAFSIEDVTGHETKLDAAEPVR